MQMKERIRARCPKEFYKKLEKAAKKRRKTVSELVRYILENWLRRNKSS